MVTLILGLVAAIGGVYLWSLGGWAWFWLFVKALMAVIPVSLVLGGIVAVIAGISSIKEKAAEKKDAATSEKKEETPPAA